MVLIDWVLIVGTVLIKTPKVEFTLKIVLFISDYKKGRESNKYELKTSSNRE